MAFYNYYCVSLSMAEESQEYIRYLIKDIDHTVALTRYPNEIIIGDVVTDMPWWKGDNRTYQMSTLPAWLQDALIILDSAAALQQIILAQLGCPPEQIVYLCNKGTYLSLIRPPSNVIIPANRVTPGHNWLPGDPYNDAPVTICSLAHDLFGMVNPLTLQAATELVTHPEAIEALSEDPSRFLDTLPARPDAEFSCATRELLPLIVVSPSQIRQVIETWVGPFG